MTTFNGERLITINAHAGEEYCIQYEADYFVNILNQTDGVISVSPQKNYEDNSEYSNCLKLVDNAFYYDFGSRLYKSLYISAEGDGYITIVRTDGMR